jgi:hypothetical protein
LRSPTRRWRLDHTRMELTNLGAYSPHQASQPQAKLFLCYVTSGADGSRTHKWRNVFCRPRKCEGGIVAWIEVCVPCGRVHCARSRLRDLVEVLGRPYYARSPSFTSMGSIRELGSSPAARPSLGRTRCERQGRDGAPPADAPYQGSHMRSIPRYGPTLVTTKGHFLDSQEIRPPWESVDADAQRVRPELGMQPARKP